jgi:predicted Zn-dependent protease
MLDGAGISRQGLVDFFERVKEDTDLIPAWLSNHPASADRAASMRAPAGSSASPALGAEQLEALRSACR